MKDDINYEAPSDWGVSSEETWVSFEELKDNGAPTLEGRDIVSFAVMMPAHDGKPGGPQEQCSKGWNDADKDGRCEQGAKPPAATRRKKRNENKAPAKKRGSDEPSQKLKKAGDETIEELQSGGVKNPEEKKKAQPKTSLPQGTERNQDGSTRVGDIESHTSESLKKVEELANTPSSSERFNSGREKQADFMEHYGKESPHTEGYTTLNKIASSKEKVNSLIDFVEAGNLDEKIQLTKKDSVSVRDVLTNAGVNVEDKEELSNFVEGYKIISGFVNTNGSLSTGETHELTGSNLGLFEAQAIAKRSDLLSEKPSGLQAKAFTRASENGSALSKLNPRLTEALYHLQPTPTRTALAGSGSPKTYYDPTQPNQQGKNKNPIRGAAVLHMWAMQNGISAYSASGQRRSPGEFQVEHIVPLKSGGKDHINNFAMILRRENEPRADLPFEKFLDQAKRKAEDTSADLNDPKVRAEFERRYRAASFNGQLAPVMGGSVSNLLNDSIVSGVNLGLEKGLGKEGSEKLKFSQEDWENHKKELTDFFSKNKINPDSNLVDLSSDQISGVFDILGKNLGVEKEKMVEYMGRATFNNYDLGIRHVINKKGGIEEGRGGTAPTPGSLLNLQNLALVDNKMSGEKLTFTIETIKELHQSLKTSRSEFIRNPQNPEAAEKYYQSVADNLLYLTGAGENSPFESRDYDPRFTASNRNNEYSDTLNSALSLLSLDTASVSNGKDVFSPDRQSSLSDASKENLKKITNMMIVAVTKSTGLSKEQIMNPDSLKSTQRKKLLPFTTAMNKIGKAIL